MSAVFSEVFDGGHGVMDNVSAYNCTDTERINRKEMRTTSYLEDQKSLGEIQDRVDEYIAVNEFENQFETKLTDEGLLVTIRDSILFSPGRQILSRNIYRIAEDIAELLVFDPRVKSLSLVIRIMFRFEMQQFQSNWDLSVMRAVNFLKNIVRNEEINPLLFSAKGYGEFQPIESNDTAEGQK